LTQEEKTAMVKRFLSDVKIEFSDVEISEIVTRNENQSSVLNELIRKIAKHEYDRICKEIGVGEE
jgi:hypothetical protein